MKKNPQTIADLKFNWTFDLSYKLIEEVKSQFEKLNPNFIKYKIKTGDYELTCFGDSMQFCVAEAEPLSNLIDHIDYNLHLMSTSKDMKSPLKLLKFELIKENTFKIHTEEVKE